MSGHLREPWLPVEVRNIDIAFPAHVTHLIPDPALRATVDIAPTWQKFCSDVFFHGLSAESSFALKKDIDGETAFRHIQCVLGTYSIQHEVKEFSVNFLAQRWFAAVIDGERQWGDPHAAAELRISLREQPPEGS